MPKYWVYILILMGLLWGQNAQAINYQSLDEGMEYAVYQPADSPTKLHLLRVDLKKFNVQPIESQTHGKKIATAKEMATASGAVAVINSNFFDKQDQTMGLVLRDGKIIHPPKNVTWWAYLLIQKNKAAILKNPKDLRLEKKYTSGLQAGPRLVVNGKALKLKPEISPKSAIAIDDEGKLIFIASEGSISITELAKWISLPEKQGGLGLKNALNLDGGRSAQFYVKIKGFELWLPGVVRVPAGLGVFRR